MSLQETFDKAFPRGAQVVFEAPLATGDFIGHVPRVMVWSEDPVVLMVIPFDSVDQPIVLEVETDILPVVSPLKFTAKGMGAVELNDAFPAGLDDAREAVLESMWYKTPEENAEESAESPAEEASESEEAEGG